MTTKNQNVYNPHLKTGKKKKKSHANKEKCKEQPTDLFE